MSMAPFVPAKAKEQEAKNTKPNAIFLITELQIIIAMRLSRISTWAGRVNKVFVIFPGHYIILRGQH
jgi:hypothetical protein